MNAILLELLIPVVPLILYLHSQGQKHISTEVPKLLIRYFLYTLGNVLLVTLSMLLFGSTDLSLAERFDCSPAFVLKFLILEILIVGMITLVDQAALRYQIHFQVSSSRVGIFITKILVPSLLPLLAIALVCLNGSLIFDHVLWGDEAFSVNTASNNIAGILEILHYWDSHPPLYYLWLHLLISLFGQHGFVYHLSAFLPFAVGILLAVTGLRKHFGAVPAVLFVIVSGLAAPCLEYNQEVRMYSLAFLSLALCYYCSYLVIKGSRAAWFFMVLFGLAAAYSHYYALAAAGILLFLTGAGYFIRRRGKAWIPGTVSILCFLLGYLPWLPQLLSSTGAVADDWWMTDLLSIRDALNMIACGETMKNILLPFLVLLLLMILVLDCGLVRVDVQKPGVEHSKGHLNIQLCAPSLKNWTDRTYGCIIGLLTVVGTLLFAYLLCVVMGPVLAARYLYPLCAIFVMTLIMACSRIQEWISEYAPSAHRPLLSLAGKCCLLAVCGILLLIGLRNFTTYQFRVETEKTDTAETLALIGQPDPSVPMAVIGVKHLGWTVLQHYYPGHEIISDSCAAVDADAFWYFSGEWLDEEQLEQMYNRGYQVGAYGEHSISQYPFVLYYFEK